MEEADVKQLISLIESAQLQYEVDESGTVSIVCDPVQLVGSSEEIGGSVLAENGVSNTSSILTPSLEATLVSEEDGKDVTNIIAISSVVKEEESFKLNEDKNLQKVKENKIKYECGEEEKGEEEDSEQDAAPQLQLSPSGHYFIQTPDGQIIQVFGSLDEGVEGSALEEAVECAGNEPSTSLAADGVQIFVVGSDNTEDVFLINTPDRDIEREVTRSPVSVSSVILKSNALIGETQEASEVSKSIDLTQSVPSSTIKFAANQEEDLISLCQQESSGNFLKESSKNVGLEVDNSLAPNTSTSKSVQISKASLSIKDSQSAVSSSKHFILNSKTKPRLPLKMHLPRNFLGEGTVVRTDRGDMIAHNLSSITKYRQTDPNGQKTVLQNIASIFGPAVKVLQPVESKKQPEMNTITKRFSILSCDDCGATLHSERSLQIHYRRYHKEWNDECFICGKKFLNMQYVRSHIQEIHSKEESFQCRLCSYKCSVLKEFLKHRKVHDKSQVCDKCGRKYIIPKLFKKHILNCKIEKETEVKRNSTCILNSSTKKECEKEKDNHLPDFDDFDMECQKKGKRVNKSDRTEVKTKVNESNSSLNKIHTQKKYKKSSLDEAIKNDMEFKIESHHYHQQIKKMTRLQNSHRRSRICRDRTHRCYLCFKFFSTAADLDAHKENYHLAKSDRPVRVKTYLTLDEKDEEDLVEHSASFKDESFLEENSEKVVVKEEPMYLTEEFENVTIILDESMKSTHVIKPLCIACQAHTKTDFRKSCKWFNTIPDSHQLNILKKFQQFLPCIIDSKALIEPWVLCKKCALLIDKIADMEDKLNSMKYDLMSRFKGRPEVEHNSEDHCNINENIYPEVEESSRKMHNSGTYILEIKEGLGKHLSDIEAFMKDTCEIMEITKPQKRPGRPRKQEQEKLIPVLVSDDEERVCMKDMVKYITKGIINERENNFVGPSKVEASIKEEIREASSSGAIPQKKLIEKHTNTIEIVQIKEEPTDNNLGNLRANSESILWDEIPNSNSLTPLSTLQDELFVENSNVQRKYKLYSESFSAEVKSVDRNVKDFDRSSERGQIILSDPCDNNVLSNGISNTVLPENSLPTPYSNTTENCIDGKVSQNHITFEGNKSDGSTGFESRDEITMPLNKHSRGDPEIILISHNTEECKDLQSSSTTSREDEQACDGKHLKQSKTATKHSEIRAEREKMCSRVEGNSVKPWICNECHKGFSTQRGACEHYAASHKGQNYSCDHCSASYVRKRDLIGHYNKVHLNIQPYKCRVPECSSKFSSHSALYRHLQSSHSKDSDTVFSCHICCATFAKKRYRDAHVQVCASKASDNEPLECPICEKSFKLSRYLQLHMRSVHASKNEQFFCEICGKLLTDKRNFVLHMKSHMGETKASCEVCGKQFNRKSYLWTHMRVHTNQKPYGCNYCTKWFKQYSTWKNHERTHTGEKPYKCFICQAKFSTSSSVHKHVQYAHYNIRDYSCDVCKKSFISKPKLDEHNKVHTGEKPFKCQICNRAFSKKNNLRTHMYTHSTNKKYRCELCGEGFMRRSTIENHIIDCHKLEFLLGSNSESTNIEKEGETGTVSTTPFISLVGTEEKMGEDSYIVIFAAENEEQSDSKEMQVTVLAGDGTSSQVNL